LIKNNSINGEAENHQKRVGNLIKQSLVFYRKSIYFMRKAKIMLSAIAVLAIVGGTLAFRAKTSLALWFIDPDHPAAGCTVFKAGFKTTLTGVYGPYSTEASLVCVYGTYNITAN
jgi:hypothetical protein